ncbi:Probable RNA-directed DNA polymerase from transposon BS [Eumeta japonica]|uniref:Probable RNA-directed DNA polymerase from transposon BS n=1 Tax=Eumeta variegata TaxID=151549 RepID=A0A4C1W4D6_EUMVA|nr:Probable RNA-directed DNA polymerase from transposon BS [Eumeta japonica]
MNTTQCRNTHTGEEHETRNAAQRNTAPQFHTILSGVQGTGQKATDPMTTTSDSGSKGQVPITIRPTQVLRLVEYVSEGFETERSTVAVFFDVAKAFDRVWHAANRHFTFRHERTHSTRRLIRAGVPQGSTLSPLLYSAYTNDVPRPSSAGVQLALFADDTALFTEIGIGAPDSPSSLQRGH